MPAAAKPLVDMARMQTANPAEVRQIIGDGNFHGLYERPEAEVLALWQVAVEETRAIVERDWP
jgi:creatinine amidohydrolase